MEQWDTSMFSFFLEANWDCLGLNQISLQEMRKWTDAKWESFAKEQVAQFYFWTCVKSYWTAQDWALLETFMVEEEEETSFEKCFNP